MTTANDLTLEKRREVRIVLVVGERARVEVERRRGREGGREGCTHNIVFHPGTSFKRITGKASSYHITCESCVIYTTLHIPL